MLVYGIWTFCAAVAAFLISAVTGKFLIPYLRKLHFAQTILEEGPKWHSSKQGTPIPQNDMWIAASALEHGADIATTDEHFRLVPMLTVIVL